MAITENAQRQPPEMNGVGESPAPGGAAAEEVKKTTEATLPAELASVKHPLQNAWTLWYYKNDRSKSWQENLREVVTFGTVEDFWSVYNHIELASRLGPGSDYSVFKAGIKPMWEDAQNANGGRWLLNLVRT